MRTKRVLLVEMQKGHGVTLIPQIELLRSAGYAVTLVTGDHQLDLPFLKTYGKRDEVEVIVVPRWKPRWMRFAVFGRLWFRRFDFVVVNTLRGMSWKLGLVLYPFYLLYPGDVRYLAHNITPEKDSRFFQLLQHRANHIYVLSDKIYDYSAQHSPDWFQRKLTYFYPAYFGNLVTDPQLHDSKIIFAIIGKVDRNRRNYDALIATFAHLANDDLRERIELYIMGDATTEKGRQLEAEAERCGLLNTVVYLQNEPFRQYDDYARDLNRAHYILNLSDGALEIGAKYNTYSSSAVGMLSRAFALPMLVATNIQPDEDLSPFCLRYDLEDVLAGLRDTVILAEDQARYRALRQQYQMHTRAMMPACRESYLTGRVRAPDAPPHNQKVT